MKHYHTQTGMGLLQLLFVLALMAILIAGAVLYWNSAQRAQLVANGEQLLNNIIQAAQGWKPEYLDQGKYYGISANALLREGGISKTYITNFDEQSGQVKMIPILGKHITIGKDTGITTPWGERSKVFVEQESPGVLKITFKNIPQYACITMANNVNGRSALLHDGIKNSGGENIVTDEAQCDTKTSGIGSGAHNKIYGSTLIVKYYPDF